MIATRSAGDGRLHLALREPEQRQPRLRLEPELVRPLERLLRAREIAEPPADVARRVERLPGQRRVEGSAAPSAARTASASACGHSPRRLASAARLIRHMPGYGDSGGIDSAHERAASPHSPARRTSAISRHAPITLQ